MLNLPKSRRLGQVVAFAVVSASLGASLMLLSSNIKLAWKLSLVLIKLS
jgi:hypothetical protein